VGDHWLEKDAAARRLSPTAVSFLIMPELRDKIVGCIVGGAIGDAMGGPYEGRNRPFRVSPNVFGPLSDDTQLTLATCEAIIETGMPEPQAVAKSFLRWFRERRISGVGASTLKALRDLDAGAHWALAGRKGEMAAGNGAAMRIAPVAFFVDASLDESLTLVRDICRITHHNDEAYAGALAVVLAIQAVLNNPKISAEVLLAQIAEELPHTAVREQLLRLAGLQGQTIGSIAQRFGCSGYVVESVPLALYAAAEFAHLSFNDALTYLIEAGGDTDTIASIAGQVIGTRIGLGALPDELMTRLPDHDFVLSTAERFAATAEEASIVLRRT
jgi:ADP-ribosylglycohydrolase